MFSFLSKTARMPTAAEALPGRAAAHRHISDALRQRPPAEGTLSRRLGDRDFRHGVFLGRRAQILAGGRGNLRHRGRLFRRILAQSDLRGDLQR